LQEVHLKVCNYYSQVSCVENVMFSGIPVFEPLSSSAGIAVLVDEGSSQGEKSIIIDMA
jgi:hypothetical protein